MALNNKSKQIVSKGAGYAITHLDREYGGRETEKMSVDDTTGDISFAADVSFSGPATFSGEMALPGVVAASYDSKSGAGAISVNKYITLYTSTGDAQALTLADGTKAGQMKRIVHLVDGGSGVLTPANASGFTTITFTNVNESAELMWNGSDWVIIGLVGAVAA